MSKLSLVLFSVVAIAIAFVAAQEPKVLREKNINDGSGTFEFTYELDNGQIFSEAGALKDDGITQYVKGAYSFIGTDGITYWVTYTADEGGFHPIIGSGPGGIGAGQDAEIDPNALKSLVG